MKAKEKVDYLHKIADDCNPNNEAMFAIYGTLEKGNYFAVGDMDLVHQGIYEILKKGIAGAEEDPNTAVAWAILGALRSIQDEGIDISDLLTAFDEDEDDTDCPECELFDKCHNERADAWRTILREDIN